MYFKATAILSRLRSFVRRGFFYLHRKTLNAVNRRVDARRRTFSNHAVPISYRGVLGEGPASLGRTIPQAVLELYLDHKFDLLGSGWVRVYHGMSCRGLEGYRYEMGGAVTVDKEGGWLEGRISIWNLAEAQRIWRMVDPDYTPIDWQLDFKSGHRWSEKTWSKDIKFGHKLGMDVKVPWELARMQHLPQLAIAYAFGAQSSKLKGQSNGGNIEEESENQVNRNDKLEKTERYAREFRNQVLDFIATNPPGFGVNWVCAMDVAIRAANWTLAYDVFREVKTEFDEGFEAVFARSIHEHGVHIVGNLEWQNGQRGNHYLADIAGLAFIAAHLDSNRETDAWLAFAVQELVKEVEYQFYPDGGNFEGSTAYHRLSAEMVYFATALVLGLPETRLAQLKNYDNTAFKTRLGKPTLKPAPLSFYKPPEGSKGQVSEIPFPEWFFERMERMAEFITDITKPNGHIPQIGDNDSGRLFKLGPIYERMKVKEAKEKYANLEGYTDLPDHADYYMEDHLNCSHLVAAAYGLFKRDDFCVWLGERQKALTMPDYLTIQRLSSGKIIGSQRICQRSKETKVMFIIGTEENFRQILFEITKKPKNSIRMTRFPIHKGKLGKDLTLRAYTDFGLYLYTSPCLYLAIRCWNGSKPVNTGHMHNDQLSIELMMDGEELVSDPGTYLYEPFPHLRNQYRSQMVHFSPCVSVSEEHPVMMEREVFRMRPPSVASPIYFAPDGFSASVSSAQDSFYLTVTIGGKTLTIYHWPVIEILDRRTTHTRKIKYSTGYGIAVNENCTPLS